MREHHLRVVIGRMLAILSVLPFAGCNCDEGFGKLSGLLTIEPNPLSFAKVPLGGRKEVMLSIRNQGTFLVPLEGVLVEAPFASSLEPGDLPPGGLIELPVSFSPVELGPVAEGLEVQLSDPEMENPVVSLEGEGIEAAIIVEPTVLDFGDVLWVSGGLQSDRSVAVSNPGTDAFELTEVTATDDGAGAYSVMSTAVLRTFAPGESGAFTISLSPNARGLVRGSVRLRSTVPSARELTVSMVANVVGPKMELCAAPLGAPPLCTRDGETPRVGFGNIAHGASREGSIVVSNSGDRDLTLASVFPTTQAQTFVFSPELPTTTPSTIASGGELSFGVSFRPVGYASDAVVIAFASNDPEGSRSVVVEGGVRQPRIVVSPATLTFNQEGAIERSEARVNVFDCGDEELVIDRVTLSQTSGPVPAFSIIGGPPASTSISPQPACERGAPGYSLAIEFSTTTNGIYSADLVLESNDPQNGRVVVGVRGTKT
ncbi:MAG: choice-of-anchor D domain-containing protein [Deltaproteobacteria bacterium]|nr:choice-of-anchor D domain-containing protein [Deltaproteobacteria bacterium]